MFSNLAWQKTFITSVVIVIHYGLFAIIAMISIS